MASVLIVDDDIRVTYVFERYFRHRSFTTYTARSGKEALDIVAGNDLSLVISDLRMPEMDGPEFILRLKKNKPHLPVIVLSAYVNDFDVTADNTAILQKPVDLAFLFNKAQDLIANATSKAGAARQAARQP